MFEKSNNPNFERRFLINILLAVLNLFLALIFINLNGYAIIFILCCCSHLVGAALNMHIIKMNIRIEKMKKKIRENRKSTDKEIK